MTLVNFKQPLCRAASGERTSCQSESCREAKKENQLRNRLSVETFGPELLQDDRTAGRKVSIQQARDLRFPVLVASIELVGAFFVWVNIAAIITPAGGFRDDCEVELIRPTAITLCRTLGRKSTSFSEVLFNMFGEQAAELGIFGKAMKNAGRAFVVVIVNGIVV